MIPRELESLILRLYHNEKWPVGTIARELKVHHSVVARVLEQDGTVGPRGRERPSIADPFLPFVKEVLEKYPRLHASRLYEMVRQRGYPGCPDHFRAIVRRHRPAPPAEAYLRLRTLPGEQGQVDWGSFGELRAGRAVRRLSAFVMVLSYSRRLFLRFYLDQRMPSFLRGHADAFLFFGGVPRVLLYDNLRSAVLERRGEAIHFHPELLALACHYRYEPRPVAVARGNEKGRVERAIQYIRHAFFAARPFRDVDDLNEQALAFATGAAEERRSPEDKDRTVREVFEEERPFLRALPDTPYPLDERKEVHVGKTPYVRFDLNDYSVPHTLVRRTLTVLASPERVRILDGETQVADHPRSYDRAIQIEDPRHIDALVERKREASRHRGMDRLHHAVPASRSFFLKLAERGGNLGQATYGLLKLLDTYGAEPLGRAIAEVLERDLAHLPAVRQVLEREQRKLGLPPRLPVLLPDDPRVRNLVVVPHDLNRYDTLDPSRKSEDDDPED